MLTQGLPCLRNRRSRLPRTRPSAGKRGQNSASSVVPHPTTYAFTPTLQLSRSLRRLRLSSAERPCHSLARSAPLFDPRGSTEADLARPGALPAEPRQSRCSHRGPPWSKSQLTARVHECAGTPARPSADFRLASSAKAGPPSLAVVAPCTAPCHRRPVCGGCIWRPPCRAPIGRHRQASDTVQNSDRNAPA